MRTKVFQRYKRVDGKSVLATAVWQYEVVWTSARTGERLVDRGPTGCREEKAAREWAGRRAAEVVRRDLIGEPLEAKKAMSLGDACTQWFEEIGAATKSAFDYERDLKDLCRLIGEDKPLGEIDNNVVLKAIRQRSAEPKRIYCGKDRKTGKPRYKAGGLPEPATVNRQVIEPLQRVMLRARDTWYEPVARMPSWKDLKKPEPAGRVREAVGDEFERYLAAIRPDYRPFVLFYTGSARRIREALKMRPETVNLTARTYTYEAKDRRKNVIKTASLTEDERVIVATEMAKAPPGCIWSYVVAAGKHKGERRRITYAGFKEIDDGAKKAAGITDFRRHDWRHDALTKLVREEQDLMAAKLAAGHSSITSTERYIHLLTDDVRKARERASRARSSHFPVTPHAVGE
jgi:integrase